MGPVKMVSIVRSPVYIYLVWNLTIETTCGISQSGLNCEVSNVCSVDPHNQDHLWDSAEDIPWSHLYSTNFSLNWITLIGSLFFEV